MSGEPEKMGRRPDGEMEGIFGIVPQIEALISKIEPIIAAAGPIINAVDPTKIRDFLDAIKVDANTVTVDLKLILRKTEAS